MIDTIDCSVVKFDLFLEKYINMNKPCIVNNFFDDKSCNIKNIKKHIELWGDEKAKYNIGNVTSYRTPYEDICDNPMTEGLLNNDSIIFEKRTLRVWKHNKGNLTKWHYDGNGIDIFNVCVQGAKTFYLSTPNSLPVYPLSNIVIDYDFAETYKVTLLPTQMLYIPAYWFHKVVTLEDNTININYSFFNRNNISFIASERNKNIYTIHKLLSSQMCDDVQNYVICELNKNNKNVFGAIITGALETLPLYLIYLSIGLVIQSISDWLLIVYTCLVVIPLLFLVYNPTLQKDTFGISRLIGVFTLMWICFLPVV
uniref:JmjC domain-containing protein n=1 Tax=viral metagenome TaxID=1070528 RepID=A0A6C0BF16_9ZZZZ